MQRPPPPTTRIVIFTSADEENLLLDAMWIGAYGYLQKTLSGSEMLKVLKYVQQGKRIVDEPYATMRGLNETTASEFSVNPGRLRKWRPSFID